MENRPVLIPNQTIDLTEEFERVWDEVDAAQTRETGVLNDVFKSNLILLGRSNLVDIFFFAKKRPRA